MSRANQGGDIIEEVIVAKVGETHLFLQGFQQTVMHEYLSTGDHFSRLGGVEGVDVGVIWMVTGKDIR